MKRRGKEERGEYATFKRDEGCPGKGLPCTQSSAYTVTVRRGGSALPDFLYLLFCISHGETTRLSKNQQASKFS